jgi:hypothetical protein
MAEEALAVRNILYSNNSTEEKALLQFHGNAVNIIVLSATYVDEQLLFHAVVVMQMHHIVAVYIHCLYFSIPVPFLGEIPELKSYHQSLRFKFMFLLCKG